MGLKNVTVTDASGNRKYVRVYHNGKLRDVMVYVEESTLYDVTDYEYTLTNTDLVLTKYIGTSSIIDVKNVGD